MDLFEEFKSYCRDQGRYNLTSLSDIIKMFDEFEEKKKMENENSDEDFKELFKRITGRSK